MVYLLCFSCSGSKTYSIVRIWINARETQYYFRTYCKHVSVLSSRIVSSIVFHNWVFRKSLVFVYVDFMNFDVYLLMCPNCINKNPANADDLSTAALCTSSVSLWQKRRMRPYSPMLCDTCLYNYVYALFSNHHV